MPTFKQIPWHKEMKDDELIMTTHKLNVHVQSRTASVKWLAEIAHSNPVWLNTETATKIGVKTGDLVRVESRVGHLVTKAYVTEGIHPKVVHHSPPALATGNTAVWRTPWLSEKGGAWGGSKRCRPEQRLVGRQGRASEHHHPGRRRSDRRLAGLVRHRRQGHQSRPGRQVWRYRRRLGEARSRSKRPCAMPTPATCTARCIRKWRRGAVRPAPNPNPIRGTDCLWNNEAPRPCL